MSKPLKMFIKVTDEDKGMKALELQLESINGLKVVGGVLKTAKQYKRGVQVADVAYKLEMGTSQMPARSFMVPAFNENIDKFVKKARVVFRKNLGLSAFRAGGLSNFKYQVIESTGKGIRTAIRKSLKGPKGPKTTPKSMLSKSVKKTLRETGRLSRSIDYREEKNK